MNPVRPTPRAETLSLWAFVVAACVARFLHLDSDPKIEYWIYYVEDEGRWVETARNLALFGDPGLYSISKLHLALSPGFQAINFVVFKLAGVSFWTARMLSAACGAAIVVFSFLLLRKHASGLPLYFGLAVLAAEPLTLSLGRIALPEVPALLFTLLAFIVICTWQRRVLGAAFGGLLMAVAISMKGTTILMAPVFLLMVALSDPTASARQRLLRSSSFLLGVVIPAIGGIAVMFSMGIVGPNMLREVSRELVNFLGLGGAYVTAARFFAKSPVGNVNMLLLGAWICSWVLMFRNEYRGAPLGRIYLLSGLWSAGWLVVWSSLSYFPERYFVQVILPLVMHVVTGLSLWRTLGPARVLAHIDAARARWGIVVSAWLVLPTAVIVAGLLLTLAGMAGIPNDRMLYKLLAIIAVAGVLVMLARAMRPGENVVAGFIAFPVVSALLGMTIDQVGAIALSRHAAERVLPVANLAALMAAAWYCVARSESASGLPRRAPAKAWAWGLVVVGLLLQSAPILIQPTYSIRDASRATARLFPDARMLRSSAAGSLLLETRIPYRDELPRAAVVDGILNFNQVLEPGPTFEMVATYRLVVHPRYYEGGRLRLVVVYVYRNVQPQRPSGTPSAPRE